MKTIDFHNHYYPPQYLEAIKQGPSNYRITTDDEGNPVLHSPGDYNVIVPGHRDIEYRQGVIEEAGVDMQVLTFTAPGTNLEEPERSVPLCRLVNDALIDIVRERGDHFTALATLPLNDPIATVVEFTRAIDELGFPGVMLFGNVNGVPLHDARFEPLYHEANQRDAVFYIHPTYPVGVEAMQEFMLMPLVGFMFDTTLAAAGLIFSGVVERFPRIRWVLAHLGGTIPYLAERLDRGFRAFPECRQNIETPPSELLKRFYYDTVNFDPACMKLAVEFAGADQILAGSDYPHKIGSLSLMNEAITGLELTQAEKDGIRGGNAARLLSLGA